MTLQELINHLIDIQSSLGPNDDPEVRLACQPQWPFEYSIAQVVFPDQPRVVTRDEYEAMDEGEQERLDEEADAGTVVYQEEDQPLPEPIVYIGEGRQIGYLPGNVSTELGWR